MQSDKKRFHVCKIYGYRRLHGKAPSARMYCDVSAALGTNVHGTGFITWTRKLCGPGKCKTRASGRGYLPLMYYFRRVVVLEIEPDIPPILSASTPTTLQLISHSLTHNMPYLTIVFLSPPLASCTIRRCDHFPKIRDIFKPKPC
jgi:hypothetical protein